MSFHGCLNVSGQASVDEKRKTLDFVANLINVLLKEYHNQLNCLNKDKLALIKRLLYVVCKFS